MSKLRDFGPSERMQLRLLFGDGLPETRTGIGADELR
jgi:hypothetical protein